jgi:hypothetical protein
VEKEAPPPLSWQPSRFPPACSSGGEGGGGGGVPRDCGDAGTSESPCKGDDGGGGLTTVFNHLCRLSRFIFVSQFELKCGKQ